MRTHAQTDFTRLLEDYCRSIGMGDFEIEPEGGQFEIDDVTIIVRHDEDFERLSMVAPIGEVDANSLGRLAPQLLQLNAGLALSGGQAFCANMESGEVSLQQSLPLKNLSADDVDATLMTFAEKARSARTVLAGLNDIPFPPLEEAGQGAAPEAPVVLFRP